MKKTYVTTMPDHVGAFLAASRRIAQLGLNITRVSYNKAVDMHTLFIEAEGTPEQHLRAQRALAEIGCLQSDGQEQSVVLLAFILRDVPGSITAVLELIQSFNFNISYMSSQENGTDYQAFKMGLFVENRQQVADFLAEAEKLCEVQVIDYNHTQQNFDNSIFYRSYAAELTRRTGLGDAAREALLIHVNLAMQVLDEQGLSPYRTFDSIGRFADLLAACRGNAFSPRITTHRITDATQITLIEPPCGSNTAIVQSVGQTLFIDTGYACYAGEMLNIFRQLVPDFDRAEKRVFVTHADVDHCGLLPLFDIVETSVKSAECLRLEYAGEDGYREQNTLHRPYIKICKTLTGYHPPEPDRVRVVAGDLTPQAETLRHAGEYRFGELRFEVYEGKGGHLPGELVLIDYAHKIAFTGDVYVNLKEMTAEQAAYNQYAPILMTSVDSDPALCAQERAEVFQRLGVGEWRVFGAHGMKRDYRVHA
jgi:glyoxylase-like metal-dependent hydrolase (beta-lactamase superfamily II)/predicted amino acid-binding ACT domain protein